MGLGTMLWHWLSTKVWFDWLCLFLIINPYFLCYYGYDSIGSIMDDTEKLFHTDKAGIGLLYSMHSIPVIATVFFIGIVIDKFGTQKTAMVLAVCTLLGSICVATGHRHFGVLILGRLLFGFGSESMSVTAQKMLSQKFKDSMLSLAFGFQIFWGQLGSCVVFVLMPILNDKLGTVGALWSVPVYGVFSVLTTAAYYWIDSRQSSFTKARSSPPVSPNSSLHEDSSLPDQAHNNIVYTTSSSSLLAHSLPRPRDAKYSDHSDHHSQSPSSSDYDEIEQDPDLLDTRNIQGKHQRRNLSLRSSSSSSSSLLPRSLEEDAEHIALEEHPITEAPGDRFQFKDLTTFPLSFWVLLILYFSVSTTFFVWNSFGGDRLHEKYGIQPKKAGMVVALSNLAAMASPLTGFFVDRVGHRTKFILSGVVLMLLTYCAITWTNLLPTMWYVLLGIGVSLCQPIVFASVSLVVKETVTGTAFALMSLALNIGQVAMPAIVGSMRAKSGSYQTSNYVFVALALVALLFAAILFILERRMKLLDTVGLWRGTAPPSTYSELFSNGPDSAVIHASPLAIEQGKLLPDEFLPNSYTEATHSRLTAPRNEREVSDDEATQPLTGSSSAY